MATESQLGENYLGSIQEQSIVNIANSEHTPLIDLQHDLLYQKNNYETFLN